MTLHTAPTLFAPLVSAQRGTTTKEHVVTACPASLQARLERLTRHSDAERRAAVGAIEARYTAECADIAALAKHHQLTAEESQRRYGVAYQRQQEATAQIRAATSLGDRGAIAEQAHAAAVQAVEAIWETYITELETRFG